MTGLSTCAIEVEEIVDLLEPMNNDSDEEIDDEIPIKTVKFSNALHCSETVKTYLIQQDVKDNVFSSRHHNEKELF
ncbi:hypothetical protein TNCV_2911271 [Trichonephila clavipes]|nr:hypothetical protein TNCV_2911271 [Trichonephila clavipes]